MNKAYIKFLVLLTLSLHGDFASADSGRFGGGLLSFGKNNIDGGEVSRKELVRERQTIKATGRNNEKRARFVDQAVNNESIKQSPENSNAPLKKNRMTPDERRALRRQIHDVGNDLYVPPK